MLLIRLFSDILILGDFRLEHIPVPDVGDEEVLIRVLAVGICAGDAKRYHGAPYFWEGKKAFKRVLIYCQDKDVMENLHLLRHLLYWDMNLLER